MLWLATALAHSVVTAHNANLNRRYRQCGYRLTMWRSFLASLIWLPVVLVSPWPTDAFFYATAFFGGLAMLVAFTIGSNLAAQHNGRIAILHQPITAMLVFVAWLFISEPARAHFTEEPFTALIAILAAFIMVFALAHMRKNDVSWGILQKIIPVIALTSCSVIFVRLAMPADILFDRLPVFLFLMFAITTLGCVAMYPWRPNKSRPSYTPLLFKVSCISAVAGSINQTLVLIAIAHAPNPAYVNLIALLTPVWLLAYHRLRGIPDDASPFAGLILVCGAMALVAASF